MKLSASHILVLALAVGCVSQPQESVLKDAVRANRMAARSRVVGSEDGRASTRTRYEAAKDVFLRGTPASFSNFEVNSLSIGRCVFTAKPTTAYGAIATVHGDPGRGKFLIPTLINDTLGALPENRKLNAADLKATYDRHQLLLPEFTQLSDQIPKSFPFYEVLSAKIDHAIHFFFGARELENTQTSGTLIGFRVVQTEPGPKGVPGFAVEHYCANPRGCRASVTLPAYRYLEPFAYCVYSDRHRVQ